MAFSLLMLHFISPSQVHSLALCSLMARSPPPLGFPRGEGASISGRLFMFRFFFFFKEKSRKITHFGKDK